MIVYNDKLEVESDKKKMNYHNLKLLNHELV